jgi:hypothetical protein
LRKAQASGGAVTIDIGGTAANTGYSVLNVVDAASLSGTLNVNLENGFVPKVGNKFDILDYSSETGTFATLNLPTVTGDHWTVAYDAKDVVLTLVAGPGSAVVGDNLSAARTAVSGAQGTLSASSARRVSRNMGAGSGLASTQGPVAILSRAITCFGARLMGSPTCGIEGVANVASGGEVHSVASAGAGIGPVRNGVHNNVAVAIRSMSGGPASVSHMPSVSATDATRIYLCTYLPSSIAHTMGCN